MAENQFLALLEQEQPAIKAMLPDYIGADRWWALAYEVSRSASLRDCAEKNPLSMIAALKKLADWGLELDGEEAIIVPYFDPESRLPVAEAQPMYKGLMRRAIDAGVAVHIYAEVVRDGEECSVTSGSRRELIHKPMAFTKGRKVIGAYAVAVLANGITDFEILNEDDIAAVKGAALRMAQRRKKDAGESPAWRFFPNEMIKKSVIRRLCKRLRGKRDTDAGRRYAEMLNSDKPFDIETESRELPPDNNPPDNSPKVKEDPYREVGMDQPHLAASSKLTLQPDAGPISDTDIAALSAQWRSLHNGRSTGASEWLVRHFGVSDFAELRADQAAECGRLMTEGQ